MSFCLCSCFHLKFSPLPSMFSPARQQFFGFFTPLYWRIRWCGLRSQENFRFTVEPSCLRCSRGHVQHSKKVAIIDASGTSFCADLANAVVWVKQLWRMIDIEISCLLIENVLVFFQPFFMFFWTDTNNSAFCLSYILVAKILMMSKRCWTWYE